LESESGRNLLEPEKVLEMATEAAACNYETGTKWGKTIGFRYGSLTEDLHTGFWLHCEGWTSVFCDPAQAAFLGDAPKTLHDALSQCKRWTVGQYEVGFTRHSTLTFGVRKTSLGLGLTYSHLAFWGLWSIPIRLSPHMLFCHSWLWSTVGHYFQSHQIHGSTSTRTSLWQPIPKTCLTSFTTRAR